MIGAILAVGQMLGSGISAYGQMESARQNAKALEFNAMMQQWEAAQAQQRAMTQIEDMRKEQQKLLSSQTASYAAQNVDVSTGVPVQLAEATDVQANIDVQRVWADATAKAWGLTLEAQQTKKQASSVREAGRWNMAGTLLGGGAQAGSTYVNLTPKKGA